MSKKIKAVIAIGGTGGHVIPGYNLALHLRENNFIVDLVTDTRGLKYLKSTKNLKIYTFPSSPLIKKNIFATLFSFLVILYSILRSLVFLLFNRPTIIIGMGGYASFPICIAAAILKIKLITYENNLFIGKANKYLLPFSDKILVSYKELEGVPNRFNKKIYEIGNILKKEIILNSKKTNHIEKFKKLNLLVLGGSQAAKVFAESLPSIFRDCSNDGIPLKIYHHCLPHQNDELSLFYKNSKIEFEIFNFNHNLEEYFSKVNLAITRSGSSVLAELTNSNIPFISVPLPSSADNHQLKNAIYYERKNFGFLIEEKDLNLRLFHFIKDIYRDNSKLNKIILNQRQYSDKNVYQNVDKALKIVINEKN